MTEDYTTLIKLDYNKGIFLQQCHGCVKIWTWAVDYNTKTNLYNWIFSAK